MPMRIQHLGPRQNNSENGMFEQDRNEDTSIKGALIAKDPENFDSVPDLRTGTRCYS